MSEPAVGPPSDSAERALAYHRSFCTDPTCPCRIGPPSESRKFARLRDDLYERSPESRQRVADEVERLRALEPPSGSNLEGLLLLLSALGAENRTPTVLDRGWVTRNAAAGRAHELDDVDHIVVEDETWHAWMAWCQANGRTAHDPSLDVDP